MKTILAVDGSDNAYEAVHVMKYMARSEQLTLVHALNVPRPAYPMMVSEAAEELYTALEQSMREDGERLLNRVQSLLPLHAGPTTKHLRVGSPTEVILSMAEEQNTDLIVMGARGLGPIKERLLGSVSHRILTLAPCATLIVNGPVKAMKHILLPLQGSFDAEAAVRFLRPARPRTTRSVRPCCRSLRVRGARSTGCRRASPRSASRWSAVSRMRSTAGATMPGVFPTTTTA